MTRLSSLIDKAFNTPYSKADNLTYYIPTNSIIMYSGASNPGLDSQGWMYAPQYNGYYIKGNISGGTGSTTPQVGGTGGVVTLTVGSAGSHTGNSVSQVLNSFPATQSTGFYLYNDHSASGVHTHTAQAALDFNSSDINPPTRGWVLLKSTKNTTVFPPGSILISGTQVTGSTQLVGSSTYTYIKANSTPVLLGATQRSMGGYATTDIGTYNPVTNVTTPPGVSIRPGWHTHALGTGPLLYGRTLQTYGGTAPDGGGNTGVYIFEPYDAANSASWPNDTAGTSLMRHTHTLSSGLISCVSLQGKIVKLWQVVQYTIPESAVVIMYSGSVSSLPTYWKVCDGTNGTINMNGYFLGYSNSTATAHDTTTVKNITSTSITFGTELWFHTHTSSSPGYNQGAGSVGWPWPVYHAAQNISHTHTISNSSVTADYDPPIVQLCFIQFTPDIVPTTAVNIPNLFSITPSATSVNEGSTVTFTVNAWEYANGTTLYWTIQTNNSDFSTTSGSFTVTNSFGSFLVTPTIDYLTEGSETFTVAVRSGSTSGTILATSDPVTINDSSIINTYSISTTSTIVNEGSTVTYNISTTNVPDNFIVYYSNLGTITATDFTDALNSGSFTITNNTGTITKTLVNDLSFSEGSETIIIQLRAGSVAGTVVATASTVTVLDTSFCTYSVSPNFTSINEGTTVTFTVTTTSVANGTTLYWTNSGTTTAADFSGGLNSGSVIITNNTGSITRTLVNDALTEGSETLIIQLRTGSVAGTVVATANTVTVLDTSLDPTYSIAPDVTTVNEGSTVIWTVTTTDIPNGTTLYWTNSGTTSTEIGLDVGSFTITNNTGSITKTLSTDAITEGSETLIIQLRTGSVAGTVVATASTVTVLDTSLNPTYSVAPDVTIVNEGTTVTFTVTTTDIINGTTLYWTNSGTTTAADFSGGLNSGSVIITNNTGSITRTLVNDALTEGSETLVIQLRTVSVAGTVVATASTVTIVDTSLNPTYIIAPDVTTVNEGSTVTWTVTTTNVPNATTLYWINTGTAGVAVDPDFTVNTSSGSFTITNNTGSITKTLRNDLSYSEGSETIIMQVRTGSTSGTLVATSTTVTVIDTSTAVVPRIAATTTGTLLGGTSLIADTVTVKTNQHILVFIQYSRDINDALIGSISSVIDNSGSGLSFANRLTVTTDGYISADGGGGANSLRGALYWAKNTTGTNISCVPRATISASAKNLSIIAMVIEGCNGASPFGTGGPYSSTRAIGGGPPSVSLSTDRADVLSVGVWGNGNGNLITAPTGPVGTTWTTGVNLQNSGSFLNIRETIFYNTYSSQQTGVTVASTSTSTTDGRYIIMDNLVA